MSSSIQLKRNSAQAVSQKDLLQAGSDIIKESINCFNDYMKCREHEETERTRILAQLKVINEAITAKKEMFIANLENNHRERIRQAYGSANWP